MDGAQPAGRTRVFATLPPSSFSEGSYTPVVDEVAAWCEEGGATGALVYTDNSLVDPWVVAQYVLARTERLAPLVAVQPVYKHPYDVAKLVASIAHMYGRKLYLNMVAGGFIKDLRALDDATGHDPRYERLVEYTTIIQRLIADEGPVTFEGRWYRVHNLRLRPSVPKELRPGFMVSGSSPAGLAAARSLGATAVEYPQPPAELMAAGSSRNGDSGIRVGLVAREDADEAWRIARERFPGDERGRITHRLAMATSDSSWHQQLSKLGETTDTHTYWLHPFENYKTFCPYLVGSYDDVAATVAGYIECGYSTFILDVPRSAEDLPHASVVFERARRLVATA